MLNETQIVDNYTKLISTITSEFSGERQENLLKMYEHFGNRIVVAPASSIEHFHCAYPGGYIEHIFNVYDNAIEMVKLFAKQGGKIDFTAEEVKFSALHHDLGKIGSLKYDGYIEQESDWHRKNQGSIYIMNPNNQWMGYSDRTIFLLNSFNISLTEVEYLTIKLTDGLFDPGNDPYLKSFNKDKQLHSSLPLIMHWADHMATRIEYLNWKSDAEDTKKAVSKKYAKILHSDIISTPEPKIVEKFEDIFKEED